MTCDACFPIPLAPLRPETFCDVHRLEYLQALSKPQLAEDQTLEEFCDLYQRANH